MLRVAVPRRESLGPHWVMPAVEIVLLVVLLAAHPRDAQERARLRRLSIVLIVLLVGAALTSTAILIVELAVGERGDQIGGLAAGVRVAGVAGERARLRLAVLAARLRGPRARHRSERPVPDFAFTQQLSPELAPPGWRPRYVDYFVLGFTTSTAFSPTDVMPMAPWAKLTMAMQSLISLTVIGLVIARAVNVFS